MYGTSAKGARYLELAEGYVTRMALDEDNEIIGYEFVHLGRMMDAIAKGVDPADRADQGHRHLRPLCRSRPHHQPPPRVGETDHGSV